MNIYPSILGKKLLIPAMVLTLWAAPSSLSARSYEAYIDSAENYASRENYAEAARCYRMALKANPASPLNPKIFANLGLCLTETGNIDEAIEAFDVALVREAKSPHILTSRARALLLGNRREEALADLDNAIASDSIFLQALRLRSQLHVMKADFTKAESDFNTIHRNYPEETIGAIGLAQCHERRGEFDDAIRLYSEAIKIADEPESNVALASALLNARRHSEAAEVLREAIRRHPRCGELYLMRGVLHLRMYRPEEAVTDKKTALSLGVDPSLANQLIPGKAK